jgi:hypothetical protein
MVAGHKQNQGEINSLGLVTLPNPPGRGERLETELLIHHIYVKEDSLTMGLRLRNTWRCWRIGPGGKTHRSGVRSKVGCEQRQVSASYTTACWQ